MARHLKSAYMSGLFAILSFASGCAEPNFERGYLKQDIKFDSAPSGAVCDIASIEKSVWADIPKIKEYDDAVAYSVGDESTRIWQGGVEIDNLPADARKLHTKITMPAELSLERRTDLLIVTCGKDGYKTTTHGYTYKENTDATIGSLLDPTFVVGDYYAAETGFAYYYPDTIVVPMDELNAN